MNNERQKLSPAVQDSSHQTNEGRLRVRETVATDPYERASIVHDISLTTQGLLVDTHTGQPVEEFAELISGCKFGDDQAAKELAGMMLDNALRDRRFISFLTRAHSERRPIVITSHGIEVVTSSSELLLNKISESLNVWMINQQRPAVFMRRPLPIWVEEDYYGTGDPNREQYAPTSQDGNFSNQAVIYIDDLLVSPEAAIQIEDLLIISGRAREVYQIYGGALDPLSNLACENNFEKIVAHKKIDGSLGSLRELLNHPERLHITQRLLNSLFNPEHINQLHSYLSNLPDETVLRLFKEGSNVHFFRMFGGMYHAVPTLLQEVLAEKGWMSHDGVLFRKKRPVVSKEVDQMLPVSHIDTYLLSSKKDIPLEKAKLYSRMKYSDPAAIRLVGWQMADNLLNHVELRRAIDAKRKIILTSSAYGAIPTAAAQLTDVIEGYMTSVGIEFERIKVNRSGQFAKQDFGKLDEAQRIAAMKARKISLSEVDMEKVKGATVIVVDDLSATGSHERAMQQLLADAGSAQMVACYFIRFTEQLLVNEPDTEEWLNRASAKSLADLIPWIKELQFKTQGSLEKLNYILPTLTSEHKKSQFYAEWQNGNFKVSISYEIDMFELDLDGSIFPVIRLKVEGPQVEQLIQKQIEVRHRDSYITTLEFDQNNVSVEDGTARLFYILDSKLSSIDELRFSIINDSDTTQPQLTQAKSNEDHQPSFVQRLYAQLDERNSSRPLVALLEKPLQSLTSNFAYDDREAKQYLSIAGRQDEVVLHAYLSEKKLRINIDKKIYAEQQPEMLKRNPAQLYSVLTLNIEADDLAKLTPPKLEIATKQDKTKPIVLQMKYIPFENQISRGCWEVQALVTATTIQEVVLTIKQ